MRLNKTLEAAVRLANWCATHDIAPLDGASIIQLCQRYFKLAGRLANGEPVVVGTNRAAKRLERLVAEYKFAVRYDGLWPTLTRNDGKGWYDVYVPDISRR